ncbi:MAG TPA: DUF4229 domain-containing protein [Jatrophihabitans sp.]|jgi:hypothetical protein
MPERQAPSFANWMGSLWGYTILRFGMFFALWGLLVLVGLTGLFAALVALALSVPLSLVLLAGPRARVAQNVEQRVEASRAARRDLDQRLDPTEDRDDHPVDLSKDRDDGEH